LAILFIAAGGRIIASTMAHSAAVAPAPLAIDLQVQAGKTTIESLIRILGEPVRRTAAIGPGRVEVLCYPVERVEAAVASLPMPHIDRHVNAGEGSASSGRRMCFEITDGIVTRRWLEP